MDYTIKRNELDYRQSNARDYIEQTFQKMYESVVKFFRQDGHLGDYSKEILEKNSEHYADKMPKSLDELASNYKLKFNSA